MSILTTDLKDYLALITGASGGIGKATCRALAKMGCSIAVHYHSSTQAAEDLVKELRGMGVRAEAFKADLSNYDEVRTLHASVLTSMGPPTILFNNAGVSPEAGTKDIADVDITTFEFTWRANCASAFLLTQLCVPAMKEKGWGRVIFCSSVAGLNGGVVGPHYASSKSALHGFIHWLAGNLAKTGITVNGIAPALIQDTTMLPGTTEELKKKIPIGRLGYPDEIAETVTWMVKTGYVTNKVIAVDGGFFVQ
ncbi:3-oxoacyl-reductase [Xylogone sp. PMI_703]|nr:3-oxoacyl-reductase [Xylogone sp. PMI_703]